MNSATIVTMVPLPTMVAVFSASLVGSLHCVGMCGPFVAVYSAAGSGRREEVGKAARNGQALAHMAYHGGRGLTYVSLGAVGGAAGAAIDWAGRAAGLVHLAALVSGILVIAWGAGVLFPGLRIRSPLDGLLQRRLVRLRKKPQVVRASILGSLTPLLPCGWLYAFVVTAAGTGHAVSGALVMVAFWLGTVPALLGAGAVFARLGQKLRARLPLLTGAALIVVGLSGVVSRALRPLPTNEIAGASASAESPTKPCH